MIKSINYLTDEIFVFICFSFAGFGKIPLFRITADVNMFQM